MKKEKEKVEPWFELKIKTIALIIPCHDKLLLLIKVQAGKGQLIT